MDQYALLVGLGVAVAVEIIKRAGKLGTLATYLTTLTVVLAAAGVYVVAAQSSWWPSALQVLLAAETVYAVVLRQIPKPEVRP